MFPFCPSVFGFVGMSFKIDVVGMHHVGVPSDGDAYDGTVVFRLLSLSRKDLRDIGPILSPGYAFPCRQRNQNVVVNHPSPLSWMLIQISY